MSAMATASSMRTWVQRIQEHRLSNGALLYYLPVVGAPRLALDIFIPGGGLLDPHPGLAELVDRLLMKGTTQKSQEEIAVAIDNLTLEVDTDTKRDYSVMAATFLMEDLEPSLTLMAELLTDATMKTFPREKEKLLGEIAMDLDSPKSRASDLLVRSVFDGLSYGVTGSVLLEQLPELTETQALIDHYRQVYRVGRCVFVLAGALTDGELVNVIGLIEDKFPEEARAVGAVGTAAGTRAKNLVFSGNQYVTFERDDSNQLNLFQAWLAPELKDPDISPLTVMNTILGGAGLSARLFLELRDKQGLAYNVRSALDAFKYRGMFSLYIGTEPTNRQKCLAGFQAEVNKLIDVPVSVQELADAKRNILGRRQIGLETAPQQAGYLGANLLLGRSLVDLAEFDARIEAVTASDIQRVAAQLFASSSVVVAVGPSSSLR
jgi:predicted Zn-dependent peptidase